MYNFIRLSSQTPGNPKINIKWYDIAVVEEHEGGSVVVVDIASQALSYPVTESPRVVINLIEKAREVAEESHTALNS